MSPKKGDGLRKRCRCKRSRWVKCPHPWYLSFQFAGREYRHSLLTVARKPRGYQMGKTEAEGWLDHVKARLADGTFLEPGAAAAPTTFGQLLDRYAAAHVEVPRRSCSAPRPGNACCASTEPGRQPSRPLAWRT